MNPLVSIIVPIYNTDNNLLNKCINSISKQKYNNIEIILVDDGSNFETAKFCDDIAVSDSRIIVIHKSNGGLSSARNAGLDNARGKLISFVDSDDFIHPEAINLLVKTFIESPADIVCMRSIIIDDNNNVLYRFGTESKKTQLIEWHQYLKGICEKKLSESVCDKIFAARIFENRRFETGRLNEDFLFLSELLMGEKDVVLLDFAGYYYLKHSGTITARDTSLTSLIDAIKNSCELAELALSKHPETFYSFVYSALFQTKVLMTLLDYKSKNISNEWNYGLSIISRYKSYINKCNLKFIDKLILYGFIKYPYLTKSLYKLIKH